MLGKNPSLIEYATFYGSIQIFRYLVNKNVELTQSLWLYAIHSKSSELISFLEEKSIKPVSYYDVYVESIRCHHNEIAEYIIDNYKFSMYTNSYLYSFNSSIDNSSVIIGGCHNYHFYPESISSMISEPSKEKFHLCDLLINIKTVVIPSSVTVIETNSFDYCNSIEHVVIPSSVKIINDCAFNNCTGLNHFTILSPDVYVGKKAFERCINLE